MTSGTFVALCAVIIVTVDGQSGRSTWWQDGAILQVSNGFLRIELSDNITPPTALNVDAREIVHLSKGFAKIPGLESLSLEDNLIERIPDSAFAGFSDLQYLSLARNLIVDIRNGICFTGLDKLKVLNLDHNNIAYKDQNFLNNLPKLTHLYLRHNHMNNPGHVGDVYMFMTFSSSSLTHLYLSDNNIRGSVCCSFSTRLTHLSLEDNKVDSILDCKLLKSLLLDGNSVEELFRVHVPHVEFLSMARNQISALSSSDTDELKNITGLVLSYNGITEIQIGVFHKMSYLEHLALDGNEIQRFMSASSGYQFLERSFLTSLQLSKTGMWDFYEGDLVRVPLLRSLDVSDNNVQRFADLHLNKLQFLNYLFITGNLLTDIAWALPTDIALPFFTDNI